MRGVGRRASRDAGAAGITSIGDRVVLSGIRRLRTRPTRWRTRDGTSGIQTRTAGASFRSTCIPNRDGSRPLRFRRLPYWPLVPPLRTPRAFTRRLHAYSTMPRTSSGSAPDRVGFVSRWPVQSLCMRRAAEGVRLRLLPLAYASRWFSPKTTRRRRTCSCGTTSGRRRRPAVRLAHVFGTISVHRNVVPNAHSYVASIVGQITHTPPKTPPCSLNVRSITSADPVWTDRRVPALEEARQDRRRWSRKIGSRASRTTVRLLLSLSRASRRTPTIPGTALIADSRLRASRTCASSPPLLPAIQRHAGTGGDFGTPCRQTLIAHISARFHAGGTARRHIGGVTSTYAEKR